MLRPVSSFLILVSLNAFSFDEHSASECPSLEGQYLNSNRELRVLKSHEISGGRSYVFSPGIRPIMADGLEHNWDNGIKLIGTCEEKKVSVKFYKDKILFHTLSYQEINQNGDVKIISKGVEDRIEVLTRIRD